MNSIAAFDAPPFYLLLQSLFYFTLHEFILRNACWWQKLKLYNFINVTYNCMKL